MGEGLAHERQRVEDGGTMCGTRILVDRAQREVVLSWCDTCSWTCARLHCFEVGLGDLGTRGGGHEASSRVSGTTHQSWERDERCVEIETTASRATIGRAELGGGLLVLCGAMLRHSFTGTAADRLRWNCTWMTFIELHP